MKHRFVPSTLAVPAALAAVLLAAGCAASPPQTVVRARAASDLACPGSRLDVQGVGGVGFAATGCGQRAFYSCSGGGDGDPFGASCARVGGVTELQAP